MNLTNIAPPLYDQDFALWIEATVNQLKSKNFTELDLENLISEVESLGRQDKRELENRLITLFEHAIKRRYVPLPDCYRGWENTLKRTQKELKKNLRDSPSLKNYFLAIMNDCYQDAVDNLQDDYDLKFPENSPFPETIEVLLNEKFWQ
ncbi:MAG: DUF29 domain-containing protein [Snowella sp.]|nr:DUF29 domain-containing protein [Snowella sp.]